MPDSPTRRIVITGMGLVSPLGSSVDELWNGLTSGRSGVERFQNLPDANLPTHYAAEARGFTGHIDNFGPLDAAQKKTIRKGLKVMCREIQMGVAAAQLALHDARLQSFDVDRTGVVYGCDYMMTLPDEFTEGIRACSDEQGFHFSRWAEVGMRKVDPLWLLKYLPNMPACHVAIFNDLRGAEQLDYVARGLGKLGSGGGLLHHRTRQCRHHDRRSDRFSRSSLADAAYRPARRIGNRRGRSIKVEPAVRPHRQGSVLGEGAGAIILEDLTAAQRRGAKILAEIIGYGSSTVVDRRGVANCGLAIENAIRAALRNARVNASEIGHLQAHGLGTRYSDREEAQALQRIFGYRTDPLPITTTKGHMGNIGAAGGTIGLIAGISALEHGRLFPILNYETPDPECPIHPATAETPAGSTFVNVNVSPVGQASAVIVRRV